MLNKAVCFPKFSKFPKIFEFLKNTQNFFLYIMVLRFFYFFFYFIFSKNFRKFQVGNLQNDTCKKTKPISVKPPNKSKSSTLEIKIRKKKKITLLTRVRQTLLYQQH